LVSGLGAAASHSSLPPVPPDGYLQIHPPSQLPPVKARVSVSLGGLPDTQHQRIRLSIRLSMRRGGQPQLDFVIFVDCFSTFKSTPLRCGACVRSSIRRISPICSKQTLFKKRKLRRRRTLRNTINLYASVMYEVYVFDA
jgi:hypothetical protein